MNSVAPWVRAHVMQSIVWTVWAVMTIVVIVTVMWGVTFAVGVKNCQAQLNNALIDRSNLAEERNQATANWLRQLLQPPPDIAERTINDPSRRDYSTEVSTLYAEALRQIDEKRAQNAYPEPTTCGR